MCLMRIKIIGILNSKFTYNLEGKINKTPTIFWITRIG
jgi:hypothetical protein